MTGRKKHAFLVAVAVVALTVGGTTPSQATLMVSLAADGHSETVTDQGTNDVNLALGAVTAIGNIGAFTLNVTTGLSTPQVGSLLYPILDLSSLDVTSTQGGTLTVEVTDTDFIGGTGVKEFLSSIGGTQEVGGTVTNSTFADCGNAAFGTGTPLSSQSFSTGAFSGAASSSTAACASNYSLTEEVVLTLPGAGSTSFDAALSLPEPATPTLFGFGLLAMALIWRRKRVV